jgi:hypothetical protein
MKEKIRSGIDTVDKYTWPMKFASLGLLLLTLVAFGTMSAASAATGAHPAGMAPPANAAGEAACISCHATTNAELSDRSGPVTCESCHSDPFPAVTPTPTAIPTENPTPTATPAENPTPTATPAENPTPTVTPTENPTPTATPAENPTPNPIPDIIPPVTMISGVTENGSFNNSGTVTLNATDNTGRSGVNETFYIVNGGPIITYSVPFVVDILGPDNVTYWSTDIAGNVEPQNMVNFTIVNRSQVNATAIREIKSKSILPGESINITVTISANANALALNEIPPEGWNITRGSDNVDAFKNSTNEWGWKSMGANKTITYTLTAPKNIEIGTYQIEGTIIDANGILTSVEGDNSVKIDILEVYRRLGNDPGVVETMDLLRAFDDFRNNIIPQRFNRPLSAEEVDELVNEWTNS